LKREAKYAILKMEKPEKGKLRETLGRKATGLGNSAFGYRFWRYTEVIPR
jgi:hypothetical protein